ncbi:hypothetical protein ANRL2_02799 [Anaerolineae bacterium]|nr:hypothetical protein ANRL2_02799 [Anaerolineae bacterium]
MGLGDFMGWEHYKIGGNSESFPAVDLLIVAQMIVAKWKTRKGTSALSPYLAKWHLQWENYAPGVAQLELEEIFKDEQARMELVDLVKSVEADLNVRGGSIPKSEMKERHKVYGVSYTDDQQTELFIDVARRLQRLLS